MESGFIAIIAKLVEQGFISEAVLLGLVVVMLLWGYFYIARPILTRMSQLIAVEDLDKLFDKFTKREDDITTNLISKIDRLSVFLDNIEDLGKDSGRDIDDLRRDIDHIKQTLSQIQGYLTFGRHSREFGNRELK